MLLRNWIAIFAKTDARRACAALLLLPTLFASPSQAEFYPPRVANKIGDQTGESR